MLFRLLLGIVKPGVADPIRQPTFSLLDVADDGTMVCAAPTSGRGAGGGQGEPLTADTFEDDVLRMPFVDPAERDLVGLVVRFDVFDNLGHSLALSRRLTGLGGPAKGSVIVVTVTILAQMIDFVKIFTRRPRKIDEK